VSTLCLSRPHEPERQWFTATQRTVKADCALVVLETDEGLCGVGEASAYGVPTQIRDWVSFYTPDLLGRDIQEQNLIAHPHGRPWGRWAHDCAVAGLDCALWDLRARAAGVSVLELLGGTPVKQVKLYASGGCKYDWRDHPETLLEEVLGYVAQGYGVCKVRLGTHWAWDGVTVERFLELMRALHAAVGGRARLALDGNSRLTLEQALGVSRGIEALDFAWFEDPLPNDDVEGYLHLRAAVGLPISGGENWATLEQLRPSLEQGAFSFIHPDAGLSGLTEAVRIARAARRLGVGLRPHSWHNGLMALANAHLAAAFSHEPLLERNMLQGPLQWEILKNPPRIVNGALELPAGPGFGVELSPNLEERFPYIEGHYAVEVSR